MGDVDDVAVISLEPVVRSPRFYAQFVELVNAIKMRPLLTQIHPLIVSPKSHHHHRHSGRYLDVSGRISAPFRSTLESFLKLSRRPFDPVSTTSQSVRSFPRYSRFPSTSPPLPPLAFQVWKSGTFPYTCKSPSTILGWNLSSPIISVVAFLLPYHHFPWTPSLTSKYPIRASPGGPCVNPVVFPMRLAAQQPFLSRPW